MRTSSMQTREIAEKGLTLTELSIAMALAAFLAGAVVTVQMTSTQRFESSLVEHRVNAVSRQGVGELKKELRSCLWSSVQSNPYKDNQGATLFEFQQAVSFDADNGIANWGAGDLVDAKIEYAVEGTDLVRRIRDEGNLVVSQSVLIDNLDLNPQGGVPVNFVWDSAARTVGVEVNREFKMDGNTVKRKVKTLVYIDPVFKF